MFFYLGFTDLVLTVSRQIFWTMLTVIIHLLGKYICRNDDCLLANVRIGLYGNNIGLNEQTAMLVPDSKVADMILGSKLAFMNWIWYICYIWCLKGVLLCLYWKLTYVNVPSIKDRASEISNSVQTRNLAPSPSYSSFSILCSYLAHLPLNTYRPLQPSREELADQTLPRRQVSTITPDNPN
jgi:hypothetical protein